MIGKPNDKPDDKPKCQHENFDANVTVVRIVTEGGMRFSADVRVRCRDCRTNFRFIGLPSGVDLNSPTVDITAFQAMLPCAPAGEVIPELEGGTPSGFSVRRKA